VKLFYCDVGAILGDGGNFGDDLNPWLWPKLLPGAFGDDSETLFVGIGTLLNERVPPAKATLVFGTGVGYGEAMPKIDDSWRIYCLRGPLSARALGVSPDLAVTDGALLVRQFVTVGGGRKRYPFSFMPHHLGARALGPVWENACARLGYGYIDPRGPVEQVLGALDETEVLLAEAMHGAIVADALGVPWAPVVTSRSIVFSFKWEDWCKSVEVEYTPNRLFPLRSVVGRMPLGKKARMAIAERVVRGQLRRIARSARPSLSREAVKGRLFARLTERLDSLRQDLLNGLGQ